MPEVRLLVDANNHLGEGPLWDVKEERLYWIDSTAAEIYSCRADGSDVKRYFVPRHIGSMALRERGGAVVALANGLHFYDFDAQTVQFIADPESDDPETRFNDGKVDRRGRFVAGTMSYDFDRYDADRGQRSTRSGGLYRLDTDGKVTRLDSGISCSNGPCWSPDNKTFYFTDTYSKEMYAYDYDIETGAATNKRLFVSAHDMAGTFDGATVDEEGYVWSALVFGGRILRFAPDGKLDRIVPFPVRNLTSVMFGGPNLDILYVSTMGRPMWGIPQKERDKGGLFAVTGLGVRGIPEPRFAG
ncbi:MULTISPECIES: SMP-30/gluconolactonase/LRE family protein [Caballeronia]|uniref:SMP-30/gluconolactonase/LRE family protein n=1 Tax=Caballeronia jiangsuensis TaxID=1458357 RepID=A0ABW9CN14_9BURK|nr:MULTISPECIES: SMP-30/gluconolactonase/LRE family protein [unclassified Caballeronia]MBC8638198.1 SMP-30/gluconolactonase/LRE family protein [Caballeronia sp. EK]